MTKALYTKMTQWFKSHEKAYKVLYFIYKYLPKLFMVAYPLMLIYKTVFAVLIGLSRILAGVHYISDVLFASLLSILFGIVFF